MKFACPPSKTIKELFKEIPYDLLSGTDRLKISSISYRSKECCEGGMFFCIKGFKLDGHKFIPEAVSRGANAVVVEKNVKLIPKITTVKVKNSREALALSSTALFDHPSTKLNLIGITGTNGKTTVSFLINEILEKANFKTGLLGTITNKIGNEFLPVNMTTPESLDLQNYLFLMMKNDCKFAVMEVSSHAIVLKRILGCNFYAGVMTNVTHDHLDFHKTFSNYLIAKKSFFQNYINKKDSFAVLNADDDNFDFLASDLKIPFKTYGIKKKADFMAKDVSLTGERITFDIKIKNKNYKIKSKLNGFFNVYNLLAAIAFSFNYGLPPDVVINTISNFKPLPGRFESIDENQDFRVIVDYAHTPDGLENVLKSAREITQGKLYLVFGCGGDRDKKKRPLMGKIAGKYADFSIITSDNPRSEDPHQIAEEILWGLSKVNKKNNVLLELDRFSAIEKAISLAKKNDTVLIAGKGHENYQIFKDKTIHFDDREVARILLKRRVK